MKIVENRKEAKDNRSIVLKSYSTVISLDFDGYWNIIYDVYGENPPNFVC